MSAPLTVSFPVHLSASTCQRTASIPVTHLHQFHKSLIADNWATTDASGSQQWRKELVRERLVRSGWLDKRGDKHRSRWKRRWFVLRGGLFAYYNDESEYSPLCIVNTLEIHSVTAISYSAKREHVLAIVTRKRTFYLDATARVELEAWLVAFDEVVRSLPPAAPSLLSLSELHPLQAIPANDNSTQVHQQQQQHARRLSCPILPSDPSPINTEPPNPPISSVRLSGIEPIPASVKSDLNRQFTHRAGWIWRYERRNLSRTVPLIMGSRHWKRRWCVLRGDRFLVYKDEREYSPMRVIALHHILDVLSTPMTKGVEKVLPNLVMDEKYLSTCFHMVAAGKTYQLAAESRTELVGWVNDLRRLVAPFQIGISEKSSEDDLLTRNTDGHANVRIGRPVSAPVGELNRLVTVCGIELPATDDDDEDEEIHDGSDESIKNP